MSEYPANGPSMTQPGDLPPKPEMELKTEELAKLLASRSSSHHLRSRKSQLDDPRWIGTSPRGTLIRVQNW